MDLICGLINTNGMKSATVAGLPCNSKVEGRSVAPRTSITVSCSAWPTCCAARPTPAAAYIVSSKSSINCLIGGVIFSMRAPLCRRAGWPYLRIGKTISSDEGRGCRLEVKHGGKQFPELKGEFKIGSRRREEADFGAKNNSPSLPRRLQLLRRLS